jgi:hypothetical protein
VNARQLLNAEDGFTFLRGAYQQPGRHVFFYGQGAIRERKKSEAEAEINLSISRMQGEEPVIKYDYLRQADEIGLVNMM